VLFQQITASRVFFFVIVCINICNYEGYSGDRNVM
jgi:hypothetical protein